MCIQLGWEQEYTILVEKYGEIGHLEDKESNG